MSLNTSRLKKEIWEYELSNGFKVVRILSRDSETSSYKWILKITVFNSENNKTVGKAEFKNYTRDSLTRRFKEFLDNSNFTSGCERHLISDFRYFY